MNARVGVKRDRRIVFRGHVLRTPFFHVQWHNPTGHSGVPQA
jgi:hypothetical protein